MITIVDYHKGNLQSVERGLQLAGAETCITDDPERVAAAEAIVLPGVGSFADAANALEELGLATVLRERIAAGVPFLGICLGLQLLFEGGAEHAEGAITPGLGVIPGIVEKLPAQDAAGNTYKIPHVGWNNVDYSDRHDDHLDDCCKDRKSTLFEGIPSGEYFYFTHSFAAPESDATIATAHHSVVFPCAVQVGDACFGVQFHPEKSSDAGIALLKNFVELAKRS